MMDKRHDSFYNQAHRVGRICTVCVLLSFIAAPALMTVVFDLELNVAATTSAALAILAFMAPMAISEFLSYAPALGIGLYLSLMTGNTMNMKIPAVLSSLNAVGVDPNSKEGDIVRILAVGMSSIVTMGILVIGMIGLQFLMPVLSAPILQPAFSNVLPAVMGPLAIPLMLKDIKLNAFSVGFVVIMTLILGVSAMASMSSYFIIITLILTTAWKYFLISRTEKTSSVSQR